jgi:hypothetical protein
MNSPLLRHPAAAEAPASAVSKPRLLEAANSCASLVLVESRPTPAHSLVQPRRAKRRLYFQVLAAMLAGLVMLAITIALVTPAVVVPVQSMQHLIGA